MKRFNGSEFSHHFPYGISLRGPVWEHAALPELLEMVEQSRDPQPEILYSRGLSHRLNRSEHPSEVRPHEPVRGAVLVAFALLSEVFRYMIHRYCHHERPGALGRALESITALEGIHSSEAVLKGVLSHHPPSSLQLGEQSLEGYLNGHWEGIPNRWDLTKEAILLSLQSNNPAVGFLTPVFDDRDLRKIDSYLRFLARIEEYFDSEPALPGSGQTLIHTLRAPILACPHSLQGQWEYIARHWASLLPEGLARKLVLAGDLLREEEKMRGFGEPQAEVLTFGRGGEFADLYPEYERYSQDEDWMSNVVLIAKSTYVWLDQLSKKHRRDIHRLDQVPDEELDMLAGWGVTGLWLIGVWERSDASRRIKQMRGNPEAVASAYSLWDYIVAHDLGGEAAYENLSRRAWERGIRLASDMVPNHVGIDSKWVHEHPDWFVQLGHSPYPNYRYTGENLSSNPGVGIYIEDGYWDSRDAAVTFKRVDFHTGHERHIYHGNDGTHMPWNDTAQLNYLLPEVREAVIQTILHVARKFPIIRFDAAMTLAKKHYQRLWFPQPGQGGDIPSRAERGMSRQEFDAHMPQEFWREVVDRVAAEAPGTLLLAEAFWLMEGYFVRTLGMHRVYNSAFMHMLKNEDNGKFRQTIKNVLEFSPQILKRFVNFMNNPDEETAAAQFGKGDKYFGVAMTMVTLPGLPMIGHGQVEGFSEKYGMEYRRAYWDEQVDQELVRRHEAEIFPLMRRRWLFAGSENFALFDLVTPEGHVDENVLAYSNRVGEERALVVYNNSYHATRGTLHTSTAINIGSQDQTDFVRKSLSEALNLKYDSRHFYILHDHRAHLEQVFPGLKLAEEGLYVELQGYQYHAFLGFREIWDEDGSWGRLAARLNGAPVPSIEEAHREMLLEPILEPFEDLLRFTLERSPESAGRSGETDRIAELAHRLEEGFRAKGFTLRSENPLQKTLRGTLKSFYNLPPEMERDSVFDGADLKNHLEVFQKLLRLCRWISDSFAPPHKAEAVEWFETYRLDLRVRKVLGESGFQQGEAWRTAQTLSLFLGDGESPDPAEHILEILRSERGKRLIGVHRYDDRTWFRREEFHHLVLWTAVAHSILPARSTAGILRNWKKLRVDVGKLFEAAEMSSFRHERLLNLLGGGGGDDSPDDREPIPTPPDPHPTDEGCDDAGKE